MIGRKDEIQPFSHNDLPAPDAAARKQDRPDLRPVIPAAGRIDLRRPSELGQRDDQRVFQQAAVLQDPGHLVGQLAGLRDAGEVALHVGHEHRHADLRQALGDGLQRDRLAGAGGAGDQPMAIGQRGQQKAVRLEERFGVTITDAEAEVCFTPSAVIDLVFGKLRSSDERVCVSQRAFYLLRKGLLRTLGIGRRSVVLGADLRSFTGGRLEQEVWGDLKNAVQARSWPALARPRWLIIMLWLLSSGGFAVLLALTHWAVAAVCAILIAWLGTRITRPFRSRIPARYSRLRELVPFAVTSDAVAWTRDEVASLVRKLVIEQLGLREEQYREDAHFVRDLGLGR